MNTQKERSDKEDRWTRGDVCPCTGRVFWAYAKGCKNGEHWRTLQSYKEKRESLIEYDMSNRKKRAIRMRELRKQYPDKYGYKPTKERKLKDAIRYQKNKDKVMNYWLTRYHSNPQAKIAQNTRSRIRIALKSKSNATQDLIGCSWDFLKRHLEQQFSKGMNWDNHKIDGWHIDHIRPCSSFDLTQTHEQLKCFHYTNLQPLWAEDNQKKSDKYENINT